LFDALSAEQVPRQLLAHEHVPQLVDEVGEVVAVDDLPAWALRKREVVSEFGVGQHDHVVPAQPALRPAVVLLDELAQRVAGFAGLTDRLDLVLVAATPLAPRLAVVPHLAALDLDANDARTFDRDDEVDLVVLEVVGDPLPGDDAVVGLHLCEQGLVDRAFGVVGQARGFVRCDGHVVEPLPRPALAKYTEC